MHHQSLSNTTSPTAPPSSSSSSIQHFKKSAMRSVESLRHKMASGSCTSQINELDIYILQGIVRDNIYDENGRENLLKNCREHQRQFLVLARMARNVLTIL